MRFWQRGRSSPGLPGLLCLPEGQLPLWHHQRQAGIAARLDPMEGGKRLANFIHACTEEVKILTMLSGHNRTVDLSTEDLRAMDLNTAALTGLKLCGYDRPLPFWEDAFSGNGHKKTVTSN